jgi:hypothetical protein
MKIAVCKTGTVVWFSGSRHKTSAQAETGDTEGLLRHLVDSGHDVVFFGAWQGNLPAGVQGIPAKVSKQASDEYLTTFTKKSVDAVCTEMDKNIEHLGSFNPRIMIDVCGPGMYFKAMRNAPKMTQAMFRYKWPAMRAMSVLNLPRLAVVADIRSYPVERTVRAGLCEPVAILSQRSSTQHESRVQFIERDAAVDTWWPRPLRSAAELKGSNRRSAIYVANCHVGSGFNQETRLVPHAKVLACTSVSTIAGSGWHHVQEKLPRAVEAVEMSSQQVRDAMLEYSSAPIIAGLGWGRSTKLTELASAGCLPLMYGKSNSTDHCVDPEQNYFKFSDELRWESTRELTDLIKRAHVDPQWRVHQCQRVLSILAPDFRMLDACLAQCRKGLSSHGPINLAKFGGIVNIDEHLSIRRIYV